MNYGKIVLSLWVTFFLTEGVWAKGDIVPQVHRDIHRTLQEQQDVARFFQTMSDSVSTLEGEQPFELRPELDLYSEWNDKFDPLNGKKIPANIPNNVEIDLSGWYPPIRGVVTSPFGWRKERMHKGEDIRLLTGDTVRAAFDGRVRICRSDRRGYGNFYVIRHDNGLETIYGHLSRHIVKQDEYVKAGQAIGLGGSTGRSTGPHLHFEMRYMGIALDPADLIDFTTFQPRSQIYQLDRKRAQWEQSNKGRSTASRSSAGRHGSSRRSSPSVHVVRKGDTLGGIARRYGTTVNRLCRLNGIRPNTKLQLGRRLKLK